ncbi:MAG: type IV pilus twitching motility protein PilT [Candidatus Pacebacteria bacterium]|nr:type IV pilus twitching motility protein PilT [Candidatus Paceibacterota bacterium]MDD5013292.1 type IV pilus twitching motility protein PilT [Candidatus Paceibacterota bacterium]MDD5752751.1 type IV pilus twitching motility protein PilT [Candidatus Paceibacterota bacterium]
MDYQNYLKQLLTLTIDKGASDVHFSIKHPPVFRINRKLIPLAKEKPLTAEDTQNLAFCLMKEDQRIMLIKQKDIDFSYDFEGKGRFRVNVFFQSGSISVAMRLVENHVRSIDELNLPLQTYRFCNAMHGFIIVAGPSGHGKSTTLAAMINEINKNRSCHIITIEDPIEYVFEDEKAIINQRELNYDTTSFSRALKSTFREDPDVIMVGEMRDPETISTAITAAETGHLVFATLHTNSAAQTVHRIVDSFIGEQQNQIRTQLSGSLLGVISQRLIPSLDGGVIPACEILFNTPAISNLIRENKIYEIPLVIETSSDVGMVSLNRSLSELVRKRKISIENAMNFSPNTRELKKLVM